VTAAEMALTGGYGVKLDLRNVPNKGLNRPDFLLFSESNSRFLLEVSEKGKVEFEALMKGKICAEIGKVTKYPLLTVYGLDGTIAVKTALKNLRQTWKEALSRKV
jgi:phosphoribosylformylglycinamidine synthase